jgi:hypothetical protein
MVSVISGFHEAAETNAAVNDTEFFSMQLTGLVMRCPILRIVKAEWLVRASVLVFPPEKSHVRTFKNRSQTFIC